MSLRAFHIIFIVCSALLAVGFGCWAIQQYQQQGVGGYVWAAVISFLVVIALAIYEFIFIKKTRT